MAVDRGESAYDRDDPENKSRDREFDMEMGPGQGVLFGHQELVVHVRPTPFTNLSVCDCTDGC